MSSSFSSYIKFCVILFLFVFISCKKEEPETFVRTPCEFVQNDADLDGRIDDVEKTLMDNCRAREFTSKGVIEANLIGEWELVGHAEGWNGEGSQPCGYITITENELTFEYQDNFVNTITTHEWSIKELSNQNFAIELTPNHPLSAIYLTTFCDGYMFSNATPRDGNMYLYQKVN